MRWRAFAGIRETVHVTVFVMFQLGEHRFTIGDAEGSLPDVIEVGLIVWANVVSTQWLVCVVDDSAPGHVVMHLVDCTGGRASCAWTTKQEAYLNL
jgi:hypothetical protein